MLCTRRSTSPTTKLRMSRPSTCRPNKTSSDTSASGTPSCDFPLQGPIQQDGHEHDVISVHVAVAVDIEVEHGQGMVALGLQLQLVLLLLLLLLLLQVLVSSPARAKANDGLIRAVNAGKQAAAAGGSAGGGGRSPSPSGKRKQIAKSRVD